MVFTDITASPFKPPASSSPGMNLAVSWCWLLNGSLADLGEATASETQGRDAHTPLSIKPREKPPNAVRRVGPTTARFASS